MNSRSFFQPLADAQTYDVEVTENDCQHCCIQSLTDAGYEFMSGLIPGYVKGRVVVLAIEPTEFLKTAPDTLEFLISEPPTRALH